MRWVFLLCLIVGLPGPSWAAEPRDEAAQCILGARGDLASEAVLDHCTQAIQSGVLPADVLAAMYRSRGDLYAGAGRFDEALTDFREVIRLLPDSALGYRDQGKVYLAQKLYERALESFDAAVRIEPQNTSALRNRARTYYVLERYPEALADADRALQIRPSSFSTAELRADILAVLGRPEEALAAIEQAVSLGDAGDVLDLQKALKDRGLDPGPIDGDYGPSTRRALEACFASGCRLSK